MRVALLLVMCACTVERDAREVSSRTDAILGGASDTRTPSVFVLDLRYDNGKAGICSAVLVSPKVLLGAGHCVDPASEGASSMTIRATNKSPATMIQQSETFLVERFERHPRYAGVGASDLSLLLLSAAPAGVTPLPLLRSGASLSTGVPMRLVGYGRASAQDAASAGTRRSVTAAIAQLPVGLIDYGQEAVLGTCVGDSGGPGLVLVGGVEYVASVTSYGSAQCGKASGVRVDQNLAFIDDFIARNDPTPCTVNPNGPGCAPACATTDSVCASDCPVKDPDCLDDGDVCTAASQCATRVCLSDDRGFSFCSRRCSEASACQRQMICKGGLCQAPPFDAGVGLQGDGGAASDAPAVGGCSAGAGQPCAAAAVWLFTAWASRRRRARSENRLLSSPVV